MERQGDGSTIKYELLLLEMEMKNPKNMNMTCRLNVAFIIKDMIYNITNYNIIY